MTRDERILEDLVTHLRDKLARSMSDFRSLCDSADLDEKVYTAEAMTMLIQLVSAYAVIHYNISAAEFAKVMGLQFQRTQKQVEDEERTAAGKNRKNDYM
jgi:hypothetical protein